MTDSTAEWMPQRIISGGQTGVDRAALDWARNHNISHGGWCPKGRVAADGPLPRMYQLTETESTGYRQRTKLNVRDSDATLILFMGELSGGSVLTQRFVEKLNKPHLVASLDSDELQKIATNVIEWLKQNKFATLNIAGPSEVRCPGIYQRAINMLGLVVEK